MGCCSEGGRGASSLVMEKSAMAVEMLTTGQFLSLVAYS